MARRRTRIDLIRRGQTTQRGTADCACYGAQQWIPAERAQNDAASSTEARTRRCPTARRLTASRQHKQAYCKGREEHFGTHVSTHEALHS
jgi:hypothetical protein